MYIKDYISKDYPAFSESVSIELANETAKEFGFTHVFIKKKGQYIGALSQSFLEDSPEGNLKSLETHYERFAILEDSNVLETVKIFYTFNANVIPIISKNETYLGYVSSDDVFGEFSKYPLFSENGVILSVQKASTSFSMTEVSKILESNGAKIYGFFITSFLDDMVEVTIKISAQNLSSIDETFERYGYHVTDKHYDDEKDELMKDRFGFFQKYLEF